MNLVRVYVVIIVAAILYKFVGIPHLDLAMPAISLKAVLVSIVGPVINLINTPSFVYFTSFLILFSALVLGILYWSRVVRPSIRRLRGLNADVLALPRSVDSAEAMLKLGDALRSRGLFPSAWANFQTHRMRGQGIPDNPFSFFTETSPTRNDVERGDFMQALPGYFTWVGLILTFMGLVVALYFAAKGFRSSNMEDARASILELLNASSFKFLTSVAALSSALFLSIVHRFAVSQISKETFQTTAQIDAYLSLWRDSLGAAQDAADPLAGVVARLDVLVTAIENMTAQMKHVVDNLEVRPRDLRDAAE